MKKSLSVLLTLCLTVFMAAGAAMASTVADQEVDGVGSVLIFPYYQASDIADTYFRIVNTNTSSMVSVHVIIRSQGNSMDMYDFCVNLSAADVFVGKLSKESSGVKLTVVDGSDCAVASQNCGTTGTWYGPGEVATGDVEDILTADTSSCGFDPQIGYIVAYETPEGCGSKTTIQDTMRSIMGEEEVVEKTRSSLYAMNAVALQGSTVEATLQGYLAKQYLYGTYKYGNTALVLTTPSINTNSVNSGITAGAWVNGSPVTSTTPMCGMYDTSNNPVVDFYDLNEAKKANPSPDKYPINEVSIVNFADGNANSGSQYSMRQFFTTGEFSNGGIAALGSASTIADGDEGWFIWNVGRAPAAMQNVIGTYFILTNSNLAWLPCQYTEN